MKEEDRLILRAQQILDSPALLRQLAANMKGRPELLESMLAEISSSVVRDQMRAAVAEANA